MRALLASLAVLTAFLAPLGIFRRQFGIVLMIASVAHFYGNGIGNFLNRVITSWDQRIVLEQKEKQQLRDIELEKMKIEAQERQKRSESETPIGKLAEPGQSDQPKAEKDSPPSSTSTPPPVTPRRRTEQSRPAMSDNPPPSEPEITRRTTAESHSRQIHAIPESMTAEKAALSVMYEVLRNQGSESSRYQYAPQKH